ncbi:MAG: hypothetical protein JW808_03365 [Victivallales bacterium]|nr:hypothetical protein [Victivallales bacterium]
MRVHTMKTWAVGAALLCCVWVWGEQYEGQDLHSAIKAGDSKKVEEILDKSPDLAKKEIKYHGFPVVLAMKYRKLECLKALAAKGGDVKYAFPTGDTLLHMLVEGGGLKQEAYEEFLEFLVKEKKLSIERKNKKGATPLNHAFSYSHQLPSPNTLSPITEAFSKYGANVNTQDDGGRTPVYNVIERTVFKGHTGVVLNKEQINKNVLSLVKLLVEKGAKVDISAKDKSTPLYRFLVKSEDIDDGDREDFVAFMLESGANPKARGPNRKTPLDLVQKGGDLYNQMKGKKKKR